MLIPSAAAVHALRLDSPRRAAPELKVPRPRASRAVPFGGPRAVSVHFFFNYFFCPLFFWELLSYFILFYVFCQKGLLASVLFLFASTEESRPTDRAWREWVNGDDDANPQKAIIEMCDKR